MKFGFIFFLMVLIPLISFSEEIELSCLINKELENNKPASKNLFIGKKIPLYLNKQKSQVIYLAFSFVSSLDRRLAQTTKADVLRL